MSAQSEHEQALAVVITNALDLDEVNPEDIKPEAMLFGYHSQDSLGLDSIDALEIALAVAQKYGVRLKADDENNHKIFTSLRTLSKYIQSQAPS